MEPSRLEDGIGPIGDAIEEAMDLTVRHLTDRAGLSAGAAMLLNRLVHEGPARLTQLACLEGTSQPAMTQMIQRLERQGWVQRFSDPQDGRAAVVALAAEGKVRLDERRDVRRGRLADLLDTLSSEDEFSLTLAAQVALPILRRLNDNAVVLAAAAAQVAAADCPDQGPAFEDVRGGKS
ncbi:MarR family winged helix-turn-helix transcriptional regulator [Mycolicibacterium sp. 050158]|uniref:MarR family winged helix-turn-helix transcriptional regulator n=1 Tax=Mycolicibacterium sp. 050158 TaxID=3090602 RepID=UPI00299D7A3B|nr:MarR family transcriptional regulator [Mycolicibacterium sp. 050158]MDX1890341.1 MarR family transcriptional regulator [Mycolicibacterium sp. 050158]